ncbi:MAG: hypothetical protein OEY57_07535 [Nitrospirota bacterium]|nr:hypothetical protein [Nitrospirota bacterium]
MPSPTLSRTTPDPQNIREHIKKRVMTAGGKIAIRHRDFVIEPASAILG